MHLGPEVLGLDYMEARAGSFAEMPRCAFHALRPDDLRRGVSFPVGVAAWI